MPAPDPERHLRGQIQFVLRSGVAVAGVLMAAGLLLSAAGRGGPDLMRAGIGLLIATPVVRVGWIAAASLKARDWSFFAAAAGVLLLMALGAAFSVRH